MPGEGRPHRLVAAVLLTLATAALIAPPGDAAAKEPRITRVSRSGSSSPLSSGATVSGTIQVFVSASADLPLEFVRLEAQTGSDPLWYCLEQWTPQSPSMTGDRTWMTPTWTDPRKDECTQGTCSDCTENSDHQHGAPTTNGEYRMRVVAREQGQFNDANDATSPIFAVRLSNAPTAPAWIGKPESNGEADPSVVLRWSPSPEPDVSEYQFVREDPGGAEHVFAVSAADPQANGCSKAGTVAYTCANGGFTQSGTYRYALRALRPGSGGGRCALSGQACAVSPVGSIRSVAVTVTARGASTPAPSQSATHAPAASGAPSTQAPLAVPNARQSGPDLITSSPEGEPAGSGRSAPVVAVAALLAAGTATLFVRRRRRPGKSASE